MTTRTKIIVTIAFFGATIAYSQITTILGTDTLSASRTTINNNFSYLNTRIATVALGGTGGGGPFTGFMRGNGSSSMTATELSGAVTTSGSGATTISQNYSIRSCDMAIGDTSSSAILTAQLGPQSRICFIPSASTVLEVDVNADGGTSSVIVGNNHAGSISNLLSGALSTAASGGIACSNTGGTTGLNGVTTCSGTLQNTSLAKGDYLQLVSGTADGVAKFFVAHVIYAAN